MPPLASAILTPLSETLLCEAVIMRPMTERVLSDLRAARIPTLYTVDWRSDASALKPAVPYDSFTPLGGQKREAELRSRHCCSSFMAEHTQIACLDLHSFWRVLCKC